jgi:sec-independent protein translocase protein TatC
VDVPQISSIDGKTTRSKYDEKRMELTEHLGELRTRIIRACWYLVIGAILTYQFFTPIYGFFYRPLEKEMSRQNVARAHEGAEPGFALPSATHNPPTLKEIQQTNRAIDWIYNHPGNVPIMSIVFHNFHEPFMVRMKVSIATGFILVLPFVFYELAAFITPALTPEERRPLRVLLPISVLLLIFGVTVAYFTMFYAMHWFLSYLADFPHGAVLYQDPNDYILFFIKMMAAFGLAFQLPVVLMFGGFIGVITSKGLMKHWRWGVVGAVLGGVFTPSNDLPSMALMTIPLLFLYAFSILLVRLVERWKAKAKAKPA